VVLIAKRNSQEQKAMKIQGQIRNAVIATGKLER